MRIPVVVDLHRLAAMDPALMNSTAPQSRDISLLELKALMPPLRLMRCSGLLCVPQRPSGWHVEGRQQDSSPTSLQACPSARQAPVRPAPPPLPLPFSMPTPLHSP